MNRTYQQHEKSTVPSIDTKIGSGAKNVSSVSDSVNATTARPLSAHERDDVRKIAICYTTNEVLLIIGLTCILNFAFIVVIMTCVHFCSAATNTSKVADLQRLESLMLVESELGSKRTSSTGCDTLSSMQDYVDSLPLLFRPSTESIVSLHNLRSSFGKKSAASSTSNFAQETLCQQDAQIPPSLSMENLLFTD